MTDNPYTDALCDLTGTARCGHEVTIKAVPLKNWAKLLDLLEKYPCKECREEEDAVTASSQQEQDSSA